MRGAVGRAHLIPLESVKSQKGYIISRYMCPINSVESSFTGHPKLNIHLKGQPSNHFLNEFNGYPNLYNTQKQIKV